MRTEPQGGVRRGVESSRRRWRWPDGAGACWRWLGQTRAQWPWPVQARVGHGSTQRALPAARASSLGASRLRLWLWLWLGSRVPEGDAKRQSADGGEGAARNVLYTDRRGLGSNARRSAGRGVVPPSALCWRRRRGAPRSMTSSTSSAMSTLQLDLSNNMEKLK